MGIAVVVACSLLLVRERWLLTETGKGQRLVKRYGESRATWFLRSFLLAGVVFGGLLACGVIQSIRW